MTAVAVAERQKEVGKTGKGKMRMAAASAQVAGVVISYL